jgi:sugar phosphate isomerase/epimerase
MAIHIGCMVWQIADLNLEFWSQIEWIRQHGFDEVSFHTCTYLGDGAGIEPDATDPDLVGRLRHATRGFQEVDIHAPFDNYDVCLVSPNPLIREASIRTLERTIRFAQALGASSVTLHAGNSRAPLTAQACREHLAESVASLASLGQETGVRLALELTSDYDLVPQHGGEYVGLTIDTGHVSFDHGAGYREFGSIGGLIRRFAPQIFHLHIHDYDGTHDHLALGKGTIDFGSIILALKEIGYRNSLCLELNPRRNSVAELLASRDRLRELVS